MIQESIRKLKAGHDLSASEMKAAMETIMEGEVAHEDLVRFLEALRDKSETVVEITAAAEVMRAHVTPCPDIPRHVIDTCGTGGDNKGSFNISTAAALVVAGAGVPVAKHGNRSVSSRCGSADVLERLGVVVDLGPEQVSSCLQETGFGFFFAPRFHPAMKHVAAARKEIGTRTLFNLLGPLSNPAGARRQLLGVYSAKWCVPMAQVLANLGSERAMIVHGDDGMDEITLTTTTNAVSYRDGAFETIVIDPRELGMELCDVEALQGTDAEGNAHLLRAVLEGFESPLRDVVLLNAAAALMTADRASSIEDGLEIAMKSIDQGHALQVLKKVVEISNITE